MTQVTVVDLIFFVVVVLVQTSWGGIQLQIYMLM